MNCDPETQPPPRPSKAKLTRFWARWRQRRYQNLLIEGWPIGTAWERARAEAMARRKVSRIIGRPAALQARFMVHVDGDDLRFALAGGLNGVSTSQVGRLKSELNAKVGMFLPSD